MASEISPMESIVTTFLTKERNWANITSFSSGSTASLPLFHGHPDKRVYISPDDQKRYIRASSSLKLDFAALSTESTSPDLTARKSALQAQQALLERYYNAPRSEFVACVPMTPLPKSTAGLSTGEGKGGVAVDYISGDVLEATFKVIKDVKDTVASDANGLSDEDRSAAEKVLWDRGREKGETSPPSEPPARLLLAVVDTDSTVGFYFLHDGMVPPRQN